MDQSTYVLIEVSPAGSTKIHEVFEAESLALATEYASARNETEQDWYVQRFRVGGPVPLGRLTRMEDGRLMAVPRDPKTQPAPTIAEQDQINAEAAIRSIYGARPNDEALWQTIVNGMITPAHTAQAVADGTITPAHIMQLAPSIPEGVSFIDTSQLTGVVSTEIVHSYPPPSGWLRAIDEALVATHLGVANAGDTYEQAKAKLDSLIGVHVDVATDPAVNGGWKLMPVEPTEEVYQCFSAYDGTSYSNPFDRDEFLKDWRAALAAAPETKP